MSIWWNTTLLLSEQFETVHNLARLEIIAEESKHLVQTVTIAEVTPSNITLEITFIAWCWKQNCQDQQHQSKAVNSEEQVTESAIWTAIDSIFREDQDKSTRPAAGEISHKYQPNFGYPFQPSASCCHWNTAKILSYSWNTTVIGQGKYVCWFTKFIE